MGSRTPATQGTTYLSTMSKAGSKTNLNESNMPLLAEEEKVEETPEKEVVKMEPEHKDEKEDTGNEKKKEKKEKKVREGPSCFETLTKDVDLKMRDSKDINIEIDLSSGDVFAEPTTSHSFDPSWQLSNVIFSKTRTVTYMLLSSVLSLPLSLAWSIVFALLSVTIVWIVRPSLTLIKALLAPLKEFWTALLGATLLPVCDAIGPVFGRIKRDKNPV